MKSQLHSAWERNVVPHVDDVSTTYRLCRLLFPTPRRLLVKILQPHGSIAQLEIAGCDAIVILNLLAMYSNV